MNLDDYLHDLKTLVGIDSGSYDAAGVNKIGDFVAERLGVLGFDVERRQTLPELGDIVIGRRRGTGSRRILLLAHMDTVFASGTAAARPFRTSGSRAYGPGVCDDKAGLLAGLYAVQTLVAQGREPYGELVLCASPDEEIGAPGSRPVIEALGGQADYALCLECARENGDLVSARKGVADLTVVVEGRAAHAGIEPERGANAALAAAHLIIGLQELNGLVPGVTVNAGVIRAGSRPNVVCPEARIEIEVRAPAVRDLDTVLHAADRLAADSRVPGTRATVRRGPITPPMEATPETLGMLALAQAIASELCLQIEGAPTGGVSDANLTAGVGTPTLDGLGPVGGDDHSETEWLDLTSIVPRVTLLTTLIERLSERQ
ncbi:M20/M25/M40 family metallo-hydrolase [Streptosporangium oxazolinicum]|uniref:M20/M25/M40 family metallo-hydrolase n=1 Tax=Streptosporangium oxazolinicum TaxID=909287 RepID=A0ABP8BNB6_9ACTN